MHKCLIPGRFQIIQWLFLSLVFVGISGFTQDNDQIVQNETRMSQLDSVLLSELPVLTTPSFLKAKNLPAYLNNSTQPYMHPYFEQNSLECGQYSGIALNFNYEINYRRGLPSDIPENQYPTHFTYNFMNGGYGWHGVSYIHSFEIVSLCY